MANTYVDTDINGIKVSCDVYAEPYIPANLSGHPDSWTPAEGGELEIENVFVIRPAKSLLDGKWLMVEVDILPLLSDDAIELLTDKCYESLNSDQD